MVEYYGLSKYEKRKMTDAFWNMEIVKEYLDKKALTITDNKSNFAWAKELFTYLPEEDSDRREKLNKRIIEMQEDLPKGGVDVLPEEKAEDISSTPLEWL